MTDQASPVPTSAAEADMLNGVAEAVALEAVRRGSARATFHGYQVSAWRLGRGRRALVCLDVRLSNTLLVSQTATIRHLMGGHS